MNKTNTPEYGSDPKVKENLDAFEKYIASAQLKKTLITREFCLKWWSDNKIEVDAVLYGFLITLQAEGLVSSDYSWDTATRYGVTLRSWNDVAPKRGWRVYADKTEFLYGTKDKPPLSIYYAYLFYYHQCATVALKSTDLHAQSNLNDQIWAGGNSRIARLKAAFADAGFAPFIGDKLKDRFTDEQNKWFCAHPPAVQRALAFAGRLDMEISEGKGYGPLVAKGSIGDHEYLGYLRRLIDRAWLGEDFSFAAFPGLALEMNALVMKGDGLRFNNKDSYKRLFQGKEWWKRTKICERLTDHQYQEIASAKSNAEPRKL